MKNLTTDRSFLNFDQNYLSDLELNKSINKCMKEKNFEEVKKTINAIKDDVLRDQTYEKIIGTLLKMNKINDARLIAYRNIVDNKVKDNALIKICDKYLENNIFFHAIEMASSLENAKLQEDKIKRVCEDAYNYAITLSELEEKDVYRDVCGAVSLFISCEIAKGIDKFLPEWKKEMDDMFKKKEKMRFSGDLSGE